MEKYNYLKQETQDVYDYIVENKNWSDETLMSLRDDENRAEFVEQLRDELWTEDSVTGNASGSYTFSTWEAEENLCHNLDLLEDAIVEFGCDYDSLLKRGAEWADVTIRCYLLDQAIDAALDQLLEEK